MSSILYDGDKVTDAKHDVSGGYCMRQAPLTRAFGRFSGKVAIVTGAAGNFGMACAARLHEEGARVALIDINEPTDASAGESTHLIDVAEPSAVDKVVDQIVARYGRIDYLFNNAGYQGDFRPADRYNPSDFSKVTTINVNGCFNVLRAVASAMKKQHPRGGAIVQTASMAAHSAPPNMIAYASSKAAVSQMTKVAAKDLAPFDIRVNSVSPAFIYSGFMWTRQVELQAAAKSIYYDVDPTVVAKQMISAVPMRRYGLLDEVIGPVLFLFSDDASYLTGVDIQVRRANFLKRATLTRAARHVRR